MDHALHLYEKYEKMLHKIAWKYAGRNASKQEELFSEATYIFFSKVYPVIKDTPDESHSSYVYTVVKNGILDFLYVHDDPVEGVIESASYLSPSRSIEFKEAVAQLSESSQKITGIFLEGDAGRIGIDFTQDTPAPRKIRGMLIKHLVSEGWSENHVYECFKEIKNMVRCCCG